MLMTATHPEPALLADFSLGKLSDAEAESIEEHLEECDSCCQQLDEMAADDSFASLIRGCDPDVKPLAPTIPSLAASGALFAHRLGELQEQTRQIGNSLADHTRYAVRDLVGVGGMGAVYRASHRLMNRDVAVKVIRPEILKRSGAAERFHREVQAAAKLAHPNIVTAYDAEQIDNQHLLVMEFVEGRNLAEEILYKGPMPADEACDYVRQAALGLQHAHEQGMVHRDIKPQNLMLTPEGQVKILDFGLASLVADEVSEEVVEDGDTATTAACLTKASTMIGTPDYIAPEQVTDAHTADIRSDIYGLGCTLYFLLTGRPPFAGGSAMEKIHAHRDRSPQPLGELRAEASPELAAIVDRMMAKDPDERYQTPADVAVALAPFIEPVSEIPPPPTKVRPKRFWSRFRIGTLLFALLPVFLIVAASIVYVQTDKGTIAIETDDPNVRIIVEQNGKQVTILDDTNDQEATLRTGTYSLRLGGDSEGFEMSLPEGERFHLKRGDEKVVTVRRVEEAGGPKHDSQAPLIKLGNFTGHAGRVAHAIVSPNGKRGISAGTDNAVRIWDIETQKQAAVLQDHEGNVYGLAVHPDGKLLASSDNTGAIFLWNLESSEKLAELTGHKDAATDLAFMPDKKHLLSAGFDKTLRLWNVEQRKLVRTYHIDARVEKMEPLWDGRHIMLSGAHTGGWGMVKYDLEEGGAVDTTLSKESCLAVSADRTKTLIGTITGLLRVRNARTGDLIVQMADPRAKAALDAAILPDGRFALTTTREGTMHLWNLREGTRLATVEEETIGTVSLSPNGRFALSIGIGNAGGVGVWRLPERM